MRLKLALDLALLSLCAAMVLIPALKKKWNLFYIIIPGVVGAGVALWWALANLAAMSTDNTFKSYYPQYATYLQSVCLKAAPPGVRVEGKVIPLKLDMKSVNALNGGYFIEYHITEVDTDVFGLLGRSRIARAPAEADVMVVRSENTQLDTRYKRASDGARGYCERDRNTLFLVNLRTGACTRVEIAAEGECPDKIQAGRSPHLRMSKKVIAAALQ